MAEPPSLNENKKRPETLVEIAPANEEGVGTSASTPRPTAECRGRTPLCEQPWWYVLPMHGKKFCTRDGVRMATRDPNIIKQWDWAENIGMACGEPSRADVLDIDDPAAAGFDLEALTASTLAATTPSGGLHLFYGLPGLRSRVFPWGEWRSTGLAVALPPGEGRRWLNDLTPQPVPPFVLVGLVKQQIKSARGPLSLFSSGYRR